MNISLFFLTFLAFGIDFTTSFLFFSWLFNPIFLSLSFQKLTFFSTAARVRKRILNQMNPTKLTHHITSNNQPSFFSKKEKKVCSPITPPKTELVAPKNLVCHATNAVRTQCAPTHLQRVHTPWAPIYLILFSFWVTGGGVYVFVIWSINGQPQSFFFSFTDSQY